MGRLDPVTLSVLASALAGIAEEMGAVLIRGSYSSNIKERRDCSTALFDSEGRMVAQAEHIPVHLGAMPEAVAAIMDRDPEPGDVFAINDPYSGGTHLPDVTLVSPVAHEGEIIGYAVTQAHHSDVGGMRPGSMPSDSREIYQEGLIIPPVRLVRGGDYVEDVLDLLLANVRTPDLRRGDLRAQIAANNIAEERVGELIERRGKDTILAAFEEVISYAEQRTREAIRDLPDGEHSAEDCMEGDGITDEDITIRATVTVEGDSMRIDFSGTAEAVSGNINCPLPSPAPQATSPCAYCSQGHTRQRRHLRPAHHRGSEGSLVNASYPSAVVAGNVETSNRIADTVLAALAGFAPEKIPAQGQGMNNLLIGSWLDLLRDHRRRPGGEQQGFWSLRRPRRDEQHAQHPNRGLRDGISHARRALRAALRLRRGGRHRGGDGIVRAVRVLEPASLSLLTDRRRHGPRGVDGGEPGRVGRNLLGGEELPPKVSRELEDGDVVIVETPGGGGYGHADGSS